MAEQTRPKHQPQEPAEQQNSKAGPRDANVLRGLGNRDLTWQARAGSSDLTVRQKDEIKLRQKQSQSSAPEDLAGSWAAGDAGRVSEES